MLTVSRRRVPLGDQHLRQALDHHPRGLVAAAALVAGAPRSMVVDGFQPVSIDPPLVSVCVPADDATWSVLRGAAPRIGLSVLGAVHEEAVRHRGAGDGPIDVDFSPGPDGALFVAEAPLAMSVMVVDDLLAGDHKVVLARIDEVSVGARTAPPLVAWRGGIGHVLPRP